MTDFLCLSMPENHAELKENKLLPANPRQEPQYFNFSSALGGEDKLKICCIYGIAVVLPKPLGRKVAGKHEHRHQENTQSALELCTAAACASQGVLLVGKQDSIPLVPKGSELPCQRWCNSRSQHRAPVKHTEEKGKLNVHFDRL